jgi:hypothetical protein
VATPGGYAHKSRYCDCGLLKKTAGGPVVKDCIADKKAVFLATLQRNVDPFNGKPVMAA